MPFSLWSQDIFSKGELSPFMYARATVNEYNNGLKTAQNVLTYPTGAAGGSGIVIIRYPGSSSILTGGTITTSGGYVYHTFTTSGYIAY